MKNPQPNQIPPPFELDIVSAGPDWCKYQILAFRGASNSNSNINEDFFPVGPTNQVNWSTREGASVTIPDNGYIYFRFYATNNNTQAIFISINSEGYTLGAGVGIPVVGITNGIWNSFCWPVAKNDTIKISLQAPNANQQYNLQYEKDMCLYFAPCRRISLDSVIDKERFRQWLES